MVLNLEVSFPRQNKHRTFLAMNAASVTSIGLAFTRQGPHSFGAAFSFQVHGRRSLIFIIYLQKVPLSKAISITDRFLFRKL